MDNYAQYSEYDNLQPRICTDCGNKIDEDFNLCDWDWCEDCWRNWKE